MTKKLSHSEKHLQMILSEIKKLKELRGKLPNETYANVMATLLKMFRRAKKNVKPRDWTDDFIEAELEKRKIG